MTTPVLPAIEELVLLGLFDPWQAIGRAKEPPAWRPVERAQYRDAVRNGVRWSPGDLFNGGEPLTPAESKRLLRAMHALADRKLVQRVVSESGRLWSVRLLPAGLAMAEQLLEAATAPATADQPATGAAGAAEAERLLAEVTAAGDEIARLLAERAEGTADA